MLIKGIQKTTLVDYPGKVASTIFLHGCNFRCPFCFSPDLVLEERRDSNRTFSQEEIFNTLAKRKKYINTVCITGGEPTLNKDLPSFITKIKNMKFLVKLDTNGSNPDMLENVIAKKLVDYIAMDIKAPLDKYESATQAKINKHDIQRSIDVIRNSGVDYEFRTTIVPKLHKKEDILAICEWLSGSKKYCLQQFRSSKTLDKTFKNEKSYTPQELKEFSNMANPFFGVCKVRNI